MTGYTKRQYLADISANAAQLSAVNSRLTSYAERSAAGEPLTPGWCEAWNAEHDMKHALETDRADIERRWSMRSWSYSDYAAHALVVANVD